MTNSKSLLQKGIAIIALVAIIPIFFAFNYQSGLHFFPQPSETADVMAKKTKAFVWMPKGAKTVKLKDGNIKIIAPKGYQYIGETSKNKFIGLNKNISSAKVSCQCSEGSGCSPAKGAGEVGCVFGDCTKCAGSVSIKLPGSDPLEVLTMSGGGFIKSTPDVHLARKSELENAAFVIPEMVKIPTIQKAVRTFQDKARTGKKGETTISVFVHISGRIAVMDLPESFASAGIQAAKGGCACSDGSCTWKKGPFGSGMCEASSCSGSCSLDTGVKSPSGEALTIATLAF